MEAEKGVERCIEVETCLGIRLCFRVNALDDYFRYILGYF